MPAQNPPPATPEATLPRPTQRAFTPTSRQDLWTGVGVGLTCFVGFACGLGAWIEPSIAATLLESRSGPADYAWLLAFIFPLLLPAALYFFWETWRTWRDTRAFERDKQVFSGVITHLWSDPPTGRGKQYFVGYNFGEHHTAYQKVDTRVYKRLVVGEKVKVEAASGNPRLSRLDLRQPSQKRTTR